VSRRVDMGSRTYPSFSEVKESDEEAIEVVAAPPGRRTSLMSVGGEQQSRARSRIEFVERAPRAGSSTKPSAGSTYSPALLPARLSHNPVTSSVSKGPIVASPIAQEEGLTEAEEAAADAGSEGPGTPKPPPRPARSSMQFDFDAFMEANAWAPKASPGWMHERAGQPSHSPTSARPSMATQGNLGPGPHTSYQSMNPPPGLYMHPGVPIGHGSPQIFESASNIDNEQESIPPTPPPRPHVFSPTHSATPPQSHVQPGMETMLADAFRANPAPRISLKRNRWGDGLGGRRVDVGSSGPTREDSMTGVDPLANPPPVYSTDGEGGDDVLESGGPPRPTKGMLPLNEEFKRRCLTILHEV
jgi:hypothetical protein